MFNKRFMWIQLIVLAALYRESSCARELRFLGIVSETGGYKNAGACLPAIDMALEDIKRLGNILKDYNLTYKWENDKCHPGTSLYRMFKRLSEDSPYHMLLGPPCSIASKATAQVSYMWNLTQLSSESSSPILSDRKRFPRFFRLTVPDQLVNIPRVAMLKEYNWERVATIHQAREFFAAITDDFVQRIKHTNISIIAQEIFGNDVYARVENLKRQDARIILTAMYEDKAIEMLCAAYKVGLYGPKIVWILLGWYTATFWQTNLHNIECTAREMALVAEGVFMTGGLYKNSIEERGIANLTVSEFEHRYFNHPNYDPKWKDSDAAVPYLCYDHIWTAALALECTAQNLRQLGHPKPLHEFTYADGDIGEMIFSCMGNVSLTGVSGRTSFDGSDKEENVAVIERIQAGKRDLLGLCRQNNFEWIDGALKWKSICISMTNDNYRNPLGKIETPTLLFL